MGTVFKIIATIILILVAGFVVMLGIAVAGSSHNVSPESRKESINWGIAALVAGPVLIVLVWLPWRRMLNR